MEVTGGALASALLAAASLPCLLLLLVLGEAGLRVASSLALRGRARGAQGCVLWPTRAAFLGYRVARPSPASPGAEEPPRLLPRECCDRLAVAVHRRGSGRGPDPGCAFCLARVRDGDEVRVLRCRHLFHRACIDAWLVRPRATCPLCRDRLLPDLDEDAAGLEDDDEAHGGLASPHGGAALWHMT